LRWFWWRFSWINRRCGGLVLNRLIGLTRQTALVFLEFKAVLGLPQADQPRAANRDLAASVLCDQPYDQRIRA